jgi:hypothetical protein
MRQAEDHNRPTSILANRTMDHNLNSNCAQIKIIWTREGRTVTFSASDRKCK